MATCGAKYLGPGVWRSFNGDFRPAKSNKLFSGVGRNDALFNNKTIQAKLAMMLGKIGEGTTCTGDCKPIRGRRNLFEVVVSAHVGAYRVLYSVCETELEPTILVALLVVCKKGQRLNDRYFDTAEERYRQWFADSEQ